MRPIRIIIVMLAGLWLAGCGTTQDGYTRSQAALNQAIAAEAPGNYFVGRRFFRRNYFFWGYIRRPQQPWSTAKLVMLNEQKTFAPDRQANAIGSDNNYEYRLQGYFSGQTVYEPASNSFYPEFVLTGYKIISERPSGIFRDSNATNPDRFYIDKPE
ncbi:MAG TPA: hypothetical protein VNY04_09415 [Chthoniobacterales bacterium]|jgi:hypothetical protein|nr:hypothetical protein [Chthoniobacterales bacterium]